MTEHPVGERPDAADQRSRLRLPLSPVSGDRLRPWSVAATAAGAVAIILATQRGYAALLVVVAVLALAVVTGWPAVAGSRTPVASSVVLAVAAAAVLAATVRADVRWLPAAVALGILASFFHQLLRPPPREGLVLTLVAAFGGLALLASGALLLASGHDRVARPVIVVAMLGAAVAVVGDLLVPVRVMRTFLGFVVLLLGMAAGALAASWTDQVTVWGALGIGGAAATVSWSFRRVLALQPALLGTRGQLAAGAASILLTGAMVRLFALLA